MSAFHDYESMGCLSFDSRPPIVLEAFSGTKIVKWHGDIERSLGSMLDDTEKGRNWVYADKVREFLRIWRDNQITGSINREQIDILKSAADVLAVDAWNFKNYFSNLRDSLRMLIASEEELPRDMDANANDPMGGGGGGRGAPPMSPDFGPEAEPPPDDNAPPEDATSPTDSSDPNSQNAGANSSAGGLTGGPPNPSPDENKPKR